MDGDKKITILPFGISKPQPPSMKEDKAKLVNLQTKVVKTPYQLKQEELERKKKQEEEAAAAIYEEFVQSFAGESSSGVTFVRGGAIMPENQSVVTKTDASKTDYYYPKPKSTSNSTSTLNETPLSGTTSKWDSSSRDSENKKESGKKKVRAIDDFLEELKRKQDEKERLKAAGGNPDVFDSAPAEVGYAGFIDDHKTTNIHVGDLDFSVTEAMLEQEFSKYGPIISTKCMIPRSDEEYRRGTMSGFIFFALREDAEMAMREKNGTLFMGRPLKMGWAKQPAKMPPGAQAIIEKAKQLRAARLANQGLSGAGLSTQSQPQPQPPRNLPPGPHIIVQIPSEQRQRLIDKVASLVVQYGQPFECKLMEQQASNPEFSFMFQSGSSENNYYRWRVYSLLQKDTLERWREEPFQMFVDGPWWVPPLVPVVSLLPPHITQMGKPLPPKLRDQFEESLRKLTISRAAIRNAMGFALDNVESAPEIVEILTDSLTIPETPVQTKIARLFLVSDILYNCSRVSIPNIHVFRSAFEITLPMIFKSFHEKLQSITGRITAQNLKEQVLRVLRVWDEWAVYPQPLLDKLYAIFIRKEPVTDDTAQQSSSTTPSASAAAPDEDIDGEPIDDIDGEPIDDDDIDGEPIDLPPNEQLLPFVSKWDDSLEQTIKNKKRERSASPSRDADSKRRKNV